jgi:hypothetical protein
MLKNLLVAFGLIVGLSATGCNLYFDGSKGGDPGAPPNGTPGTPGTPGNTPPGNTPPGYQCGGDAECAPGCYCGNGTCVEGGFCTRDDQCGDGLTCDETRGSCDPQGGGTCAGTVTCNEVKPNCAADTVPLVQNGCWTGACEPLALCDVTPPCDRLNTEPSCLARAECSAVYNGTNCKRTDNTPCRAGDTGCTCESYTFASCQLH